MSDNLKILFASAEVYPFAKTGGLADVSMALPKALSKLGHDVRIAMPCYKSIDRQKYEMQYLTDFPLKMNNFTHNCVVREGKLEFKAEKDKKRSRAKQHVPVYFIDSYEYFDREGLYSTEVADYPDNARRFGYFCRSVMELLKKIDFKPDIIHINDWQAAFISLLLKRQYNFDPFYKDIASVFTIHNIQYQGVFDMQALVDLDLTWDYFSPDLLEFFGKINLMKAGIIFSDSVNTVSESYALEIQGTSAGMGLEGLLTTKKNDIYAITNGIDYDEWNPETDTNLASNYCAKTYAAKKLQCKRDLQISAKLPETDVPVVGMVTRLADQKGLDIVAKAMDDLMKLDMQFVLLGTGEKRYVDMLYSYLKKYPEKCSFFLKFDAFTASKIYAGSDFFLMPSRFEPCGTSQLISLKYGTVPIVRATGGLADTIIDFDVRTNRGNGFSFREYNETALVKCVEHAFSIYQNKQMWNILIQNGMSCNFSWETAAVKYVDVYKKSIEKVKGYLY